MTSQSRSKKQLSFEFFPTQTSAGAEKLKQAAMQLVELNPELFSITYGAGGSTRDRTLGTVLSTQSVTQIPTAPHLACIGETKEHTKLLLSHYKQHRAYAPVDATICNIASDIRYPIKLIAE